MGKIPPGDIPRQLLIEIGYLILVILAFVFIFPFNYLFYGFERTKCAFIHDLLGGAEREVINENQARCKKCGLVYPISNGF